MLTSDSDPISLLQESCIEKEAVLEVEVFFSWTPILSFSVFILDTYLKFLLEVNRAILTMALFFFYYMRENCCKENKMFLLYFLLQDLFKVHSASQYYKTAQGKRKTHSRDLA